MMRVAGLIIAVLLLALPNDVWAQGARARTHIVQNSGARGKAGAGPRVVRKRPRRGVKNRRPMRVGPNFFDRLMKMPAPERRKFLRENPRFQRMPARQRQQIEQRLRRLGQMKPAQRERVLERYRLFDRLPREKQAEARTIYQQWQQLPRGRRSVLLDEYDGLRAAGAAARQDRLQSKEFSDAYSDEEQKILRDLSGLLPERSRREQPQR